MKFNTQHSFLKYKPKDGISVIRHKKNLTEVGFLTTPKPVLLFKAKADMDQDVRVSGTLVSITASPFTLHKHKKNNVNTVVIIKHLKTYFRICVIQPK